MIPAKFAKGKPTVFVIMPFAQEWDDSYHLGIKPACEEAGATCTRVDEQIFLENILQRIYGQIAKADIVVAEMTGRNENVFYEVGYAHGLGKKVVFLTMSEGDIPFDLRHYPHIVHGGKIRTIKEQLKKKIEWVIEHLHDPEIEPLPEGAKINKVKSEFDRVAQHIVNYLRAHDFTMMSFERVRQNINAGYSDELLQQLIDQAPERFRRARLKGGAPGIAMVD